MSGTGFALIATDTTIAADSESGGKYDFIDDMLAVPGVAEIIEGLQKIHRNHADSALAALVDGIDAYAVRTGKNIPFGRPVQVS